jgi:hypothetical protein
VGSTSQKEPGCCETAVSCIVEAVPKSEVRLLDDEGNGKSNKAAWAHGKCLANEEHRWGNNNSPPLSHLVDVNNYGHRTTSLDH